jgi:hypothetical protein
MCHHVDMAIDWDEVVTNTEPTADEHEEAPEVDELSVDTEESTPELTPPADD